VVYYECSIRRCVDIELHTGGSEAPCLPERRQRILELVPGSTPVGEDSWSHRDRSLDLWSLNTMQDMVLWV